MNILKQTQKQLLILAVLIPWMNACDLISKATSTVIVAATGAESPTISVQNFINTQGGFAIQVYVGRRDSVTSTDEPKPISDAEVKLEVKGQTYTLPAVSNKAGFYSIDSSASSAPSFSEDDFVFLVKISGESDTYGGTVKGPARLNSGTIKFTPELNTDDGVITGAKKITAGQALKLSWADSKDTFGYVNVFRADKNSTSKPLLVYTNRPESAQDLLDFVIGSPKTELTIPGSTFTDNALFAITFIASAKGDPNTNTFAGSPFLMGTESTQLVTTGTP